MQNGYEAPKLERLGRLRDLTLAGGCFAAADGVNPYHRYDPNNQSCPMS
jgi:hypothetical protein